MPDQTNPADRRAAARTRYAARAAAGLIAGALTASAAVAASDGPKVTSFTLENGLRGVVIEDHRAPVVTHMVWYPIGAADEPPGRSGIAHFLEHLMFKGTEQFGPGEFSELVAENGGQDNAFTSLDYTAYFQRIASDRLGLVMRLESDRMRNLTLDEDSVRTERDVVIEERNSRTDNEPQSKFYEQLNAALYQNHPYGAPVIGWRHEIEALSREDALDFYRQFYGPENAILIVAGDVQPEAVEALAQEHYGPIERAGVAPARRPSEPPHLAPRRLSMVDEKVRQPFMTRVYLTPSYVTGDQRETAALSLLAEIFGGGVTSRLAKSLVLDQRIALSVGAYYRGVSRDETTFGYFGVPADGVSLETIEAEADAVLARLAEEGPTEDELSRAKMLQISSSIYRQDSQASMARMYGAALSIGLTVDDVKTWPDLIQSVTADDVRRAAGLLDLNASVTGYLLGEPADATPAATATKEAQ